MTELEKYISSNLEAFDCEPVPEGGKERFMDTLRYERRKNRVKVISFALTGIAAGVAILMSVFIQPDLSKELERQYSRLAEKENEIMTIVEREFPEETDMILNTLRTITTDAIPLEEQLPEEMPVKEKSRVLNDYYNIKYSALESLLAQVSER